MNLFCFSHFSSYPIRSDPTSTPPPIKPSAMPPKKKKKKGERAKRDETRPKSPGKKTSKARSKSPVTEKKKTNKARSKSPVTEKKKTKNKGGAKSSGKKSSTKSSKKTSKNKIKTSKDDSENRETRPNTPAPHPVGTRVLALYEDGQWYEGTVTQFNVETQVYSVLFDGYNESEVVTSVKLIENDGYQFGVAPAVELLDNSIEAKRDNVEKEEEEEKKEEEEEKDTAIPIPSISEGERLGNFGLQALAAAGIDAVQKKNYNKIHQYLDAASRASNGDAAQIISTGDTPLHFCAKKGDMKTFLIFLEYANRKDQWGDTVMSINFEFENRLGITPTHEMILHNRIEFFYAILTQFPGTPIEWDKSIGEQTCHGIDELTGARCSNLAKEGGYCHENAVHVREMVSLRRDKIAARANGDDRLTDEEKNVEMLEEKINGLRKNAAGSTCAKISERIGNPEIGELLDGFREGSCRALLASLDQLQEVAVRAHRSLEKFGPNFTQEEIRREVRQALGALEGLLLRGTWRNHAPPTIEENCRHWRRLFLLDKRFRAKSSRTPAGVPGLEIELAGHLSDFIDNVRLSLPEGTWNVVVHRAWLRILHCANDVYNIRGEDEDGKNDAVVDKNSAFYRPRKRDDRVEFLSDKMGSFTQFY